MATLILKSKHSLPAKFRNEDGFEWEIEGVNNPSDLATSFAKMSAQEVQDLWMKANKVAPIEGAGGVPIPTHGVGMLFTDEQCKTAEDWSEQRRAVEEQAQAMMKGMPETPLARIIRINFKAMEELRNSKGKEYDGGLGDRLGNFRRNAVALGVSMETVLMIYAEKHWGSIQSYVRSGNKVLSNENIEGRVRDLMNYMFLFLLMCEERSQVNTVQKKELAEFDGNAVARHSASNSVGQGPKS